MAEVQAANTHTEHTVRLTDLTSVTTSFAELKHRLTGVINCASSAASEHVPLARAFQFRPRSAIFITAGSDASLRSTSNNDRSIAFTQLVLPRVSFFRLPRTSGRAIFRVELNLPFPRRAASGHSSQPKRRVPPTSGRRRLYADSKSHCFRILHCDGA